MSEPQPPTKPTRKGRQPPLRTLPHLRAWRERQGWSLRQLAALARVGKATLIRVEAGGRATWTTTTRLARALKIRPERLMQAPPEQ